MTRVEHWSPARLLITSITVAAVVLIGVIAATAALTVHFLKAGAC